MSIAAFNKVLSGTECNCVVSLCIARDYQRNVVNDLLEAVQEWKIDEKVSRTVKWEND